MKFSARRWLVLVAAGLAVAGCGSNDSGTSSTSFSGEAAQAPAQPQQGSGSAKDSAGSSQGKPGQQGKGAGVPVGQAGVQDRKLVKTAKLSLAANDVPAIVDSVRQVAVGAGGYTGQERSDKNSATVSLAVPSDKLDVTLSDLSKLGEVTSREQNTQDVTEQVVDVESRIATQKASVERVRALLAKANSVGEITSVEAELTTREAELESMQRRQQALAGSVAMSTISVSVAQKGTPPAKPEERSGFFGGLANGWDAFLTFGGGVLTVLGALGPFLLFIGVPALALVWWLRKRRPARVPVTPEPMPAE
ncbi:protein of unknown function [Amycolatopsis xylanica]|uniref:DUF4349 domain-containing protein n=1 Tax=Amycolatopsis xylanica TaxID=589385 RepID=A0A1H3L1M6_9PSEU|nr:DUF4349 domain-containing protein [Amycolatopsis xylanica]SDY57795.1 protein of unknown function [Amycolatopsis xylanica]